MKKDTFSQVEGETHSIRRGFPGLGEQRPQLMLLINGVKALEEVVAGLGRYPVCSAVYVEGDRASRDRDY